MLPASEINIKRVKDISFVVNEQFYTPDPKKIIKIDLQHTFGVNLEKNLANFTLRVFFYYMDSPSNILADISVQNVFEISKLKTFKIINSLVQIPAEYILMIVSMSISHARALFSKNLGGTIFQDVILPISNPSDVAQHFFPHFDFSILNKKSGNTLKKPKKLTHVSK